MKYLLLFILILPLGCGTETGNPLVEGELSNDSPGTTTTVQRVVQQVCRKLSECYGNDFDQTNCMDNLSRVDNFDVALGLNEADYTSADDIHYAEIDGYITADYIRSAQCILDISFLECTDTEVMDAYDPLDPNNYDNTYKAVPIKANSCQDVYN